MRLPIGSLSPAPEPQVRGTFAPDSLRSLAESIRRSGIRAPIVVVPDASTAGRYRIVAGERRWRAAQLAGVAEIPCIVDEGLTDPRQRLLAQAEENLQREELNAADEAGVLVRLMEAFGVGAEEAGALIGRSYQQARRLIQLHEAPQPIRDAVVQGHVDTRAALELVRIYNRLAQRGGPGAKERALAELDELIDRVVNKRWSIRRLEKYARDLEGGRPGRRRGRGSAARPDRGNAASSAPAAAANPAVPADGPPYRLAGAELVVDVDRIARRDVSPEEREELIKLLEHLLTDVRRGGRAVRAPVLHVENATNNAKP